MTDLPEQFVRRNRGDRQAFRGAVRRVRDAIGGDEAELGEEFAGDRRAGDKQPTEVG